ncbi:HAMP domain-containing sensor histidine kinase [Alteromonas sp. D210916BOD_24]|uniref:sensor histidine kinase n=1 Tax=Alteromonas sp. D210916BOD_24 TaxID=3157618 RepID=UPI00399CED47
MSSGKQVSSTIDFASVLAAAVHDMKNSLFLLIQSIEALSDALPRDNTDAQTQVANVHYEASRLNTNLVQILSLYRAELESLPITVDECFVRDLVEDVVGSNTLYIDRKHIDIELDIEDELNWYLDEELIYLLLNDVIINAMRYGTSKIRVSARIDNEYLHLKVEDDGRGYPDAMLTKSDEQLTEFELSQGRTGLGLFFAKLIANAHSQGDKVGQIQLSNGGNYGGSVFEVKIP